ncbi:MAG: peptidoglycan-binding protein [bacterium]|nr:peptidoglycan-binding protein [bacterium]
MADSTTTPGTYGGGTRQQKAAALRAEMEAAEQAEQQQQQAEEEEVSSAEEEISESADERQDQVEYEDTGPVGTGEYAVQQGECIDSIAMEHGFYWETVWEDSGNTDLREVRVDPFVLLEGDRVHIPELRRKDETGTTEQRHRFRRKGVPEILKIVLNDADGNPRAGLNYTLTVDGVIASGVTDAEGRLEEPIAPNAAQGELVVYDQGEEERYPVGLGKLDPITTLTGVQGRLNNLGFDCGPVNGELGPQTEEAIREFQEKYELASTGEPNSETRERLRDVHGF